MEKKKRKYQGPPSSRLMIFDEEECEALQNAPMKKGMSGALVPVLENVAVARMLAGWEDPQETWLAVAGAAPFTAVFDYLYASDSLEVVGVQPPLDEARAAMLANGETWLPNEWYASDHLPVGAALRFREGPA